MPKGVYSRSSKSVTVQETNNPIVHEQGINKIRVSQMPDHQTANANVEAIRQSHGDAEISTTERLFGSPEQQAIDNQEDVNIDQEPLVVQPVPQNPEQSEQPRFQETPKPEPTLKEDEFIDWEKMSGRKIRQKVDGKEVVTTVEELKKYSDQDQIKKHLAEAAEKVGQERRKLAEERQQWNEQRNRNQVPQGTPQVMQNPQIPEQQQNYQEHTQNDPVFQRLQFLEQQVQQLAQGVQPSIYESNRQRVANELKSQGFNDFIDYLPKMEMAIGKIQDPNLTSFYDTPEGSKALYFQLKAQDLQKAPIRVQTQDVPRGNPTPPAVQIESGSQPSGNFNDDSSHNYRSAFRRAVSAGDDKEAWNEVLRQKGILPD